jgi:Tol biopolymer transport system component
MVEALHSTGEIWVLDPIDGEPRLLVTDNARQPRFSPDAEQVAYLRLIEDQIHDIYIADVRRIVGGGMFP